jgi:hypothetical protein
MSVTVHRAGLSALLALLLATQTGCGGKDLSVTITSPSTDKAYVRLGLAVQLFVDGGSPDTVDLLLDGQPLARLTAPYAYVWDVSSLAEGEYTLTARATRGGTTVDSKPLQVVVDRTPPVLLSQTPDPEGHGEWTGAISFTASEPLHPATVTDATVRLRTPEGQSIRKQLQLTADGVTVELRVDQPLRLPSRLEASLAAGITDLAGNALLTPSATWAWDVPAARLLGETPLAEDRIVGSSLQTSLLMPAEGPPLIAYEAWTPRPAFTPRSEVARWNGGGWERFTVTGLEGQLRLAQEAPGSVIVASAAYERLLLVRFDGTQLKYRAQEFHAGDNTGHQDTWMQLALRRDGTALVVWHRPTGVEARSFTARLLAASTDGTWTVQVTLPDARVHALVVDGAGNTWLAWSSLAQGTQGLRVGRLQGGVFTQVGDVLDFQTDPTSLADVADLKVDALGRPVVAWRNEHHLYVHRWDGLRWSQVGERREAGGHPRGASNSVSLALDPNGHPVVAWVLSPGREFPTELRVESWTETAWVPYLPPQPAIFFHGVALALDREGRPVTAWYQEQLPRDPMGIPRIVLRVRAGF